MSDAAASAWAQLLSVGVLWMSVHCVGMCGPIVSGLPLTERPGLLPNLVGVLRYQAGRAGVYALLGSVAGVVGAGLTRVFEPAGGVMAVALGVAMLGWLLRGVTRARPPSMTDGGPGLVALNRPRRRRWRRVLDVVRGLPPVGIGAALALLPCMIPAWVLGLAAMTGSPLHGALLMLSVVLLTTPILALVRVGGGLGLRRAPGWTPMALRALSGAWLVLVGAATLGWIQHQHVGFRAIGRDWVVMLF